MKKIKLPVGLNQFMSEFVITMLVIIGTFALAAVLYSIAPRWFFHIVVYGLLFVIVVYQCTPKWKYYHYSCRYKDRLISGTYRSKSKIVPIKFICDHLGVSIMDITIFSVVEISKKDFESVKEQSDET
ncbi:hypothetical protein [Bacteroides reticulotermitis]|uniref:Membrane protein YdbS with pleckstrin-like domain n=1 Tax=Bacteroides reticulotermitis TaxID=1133319 RepID=A0A840D579_9BACE|nr:hypothetical protein [Bacteroides reticulotermitis]MBB4043835.1 membrane protein YdbS with pleckstrin-like domain [Bacteroides reticulotermitis]